MKTFVVLTASSVLVSILFCPMVMAAPTMPGDLQMVEPDPSLPKELSGFFGKWEMTAFPYVFLIVEKIGEQEAALYIWSPPETGQQGWTRSKEPRPYRRGIKNL
jgi:hypothetical protein